jgi:hypothetical protein
VREQDITARFARDAVFDPEAQTPWENAEGDIFAFWRLSEKKNNKTIPCDLTVSVVR